MTIEQFLRGCCDVGIEAGVHAINNGHYTITAYETEDAYHSRYKTATGETFAEALVAWEAEPWGESTADAIAKAKETGGYWK